MTIECNCTSCEAGLNALTNLALRSEVSVINAPPMFCPTTVARAHASLATVFAQTDGLSKMVLLSSIALKVVWIEWCFIGVPFKILRMLKFFAG
jgi:hypothetical protein